MWDTWDTWGTLGPAGARWGTLGHAGTRWGTLGHVVTRGRCGCMTRAYEEEVAARAREDAWDTRDTW